MSYRMLFDWIFVEPIPEPNEAKGVLLAREKSQDITQKGEVVYVSEGGDDHNIKLHDIVLFKRNAAFKNIEINSKRLNVMKKSSVLAVMFGDNVTDVTPTKDNVFLEWELAPNTYKLGSLELVRPDSHKQLYYTGNVVAIGPDVKEVKIGDRVFFDQFGGVERFQEDGNRYCFVKENSIFCNGLPEREASEKVLVS